LHGNFFLEILFSVVGAKHMFIRLFKDYRIIGVFGYRLFKNYEYCLYFGINNTLIATSINYILVIPIYFFANAKQYLRRKNTTYFFTSKSRANAYKNWQLIATTPYLKDVFFFFRNLGVATFIVSIIPASPSFLFIEMLPGLLYQLILSIATGVGRFLCYSLIVYGDNSSKMHSSQHDISGLSIHLKYLDPYMSGQTIFCCLILFIVVQNWCDVKFLYKLPSIAKFFSNQLVVSKLTAALFLRVSYLVTIFVRANVLLILINIYLKKVFLFLCLTCSKTLKTISFFLNHFIMKKLILWRPLFKK
jgi:hypothetical protein